MVIYEKRNICVVICGAALVTTKQTYIFVLSFQSINDPFKKEDSKKEAEVKTSFNKPGDKRTFTATKMANKWVLETVVKSRPSLHLLLLNLHLPFFPTHRIMLAHKKEDKHFEKDKDLSNKQDSKSGKSESSTSPPPMRDDRKHGSRFTSPIHYTLFLLCSPQFHC